MGEMPDNPFAPGSFGIAEAELKAHASPCVTSSGDGRPVGGRRLTFNVAGLSDARGKVLSLNVNAYDERGQFLFAANAPLSEEDARKLGEALLAVLELTPEPGG